MVTPAGTDKQAALLKLVNGRIGQYDTYVMAFKRWYVAIFSVTILVAYSTTIPERELQFFGILALVALFAAETTVRTVTVRFMWYARALDKGLPDHTTSRRGYWAKLWHRLESAWRKARAMDWDKLPDFGTFMLRPWWKTWFEVLHQSMKCLFRATSSIPFWACVLLIWFGIPIAAGHSEKRHDSAPSATALVHEVIRVIDGDRFEIKNDLGGRSVRIAGIDAPELMADGGMASKASLMELVLRRHVSLHFVGEPGIDDSGSLVADVFVDYTNVGEAMIEKKHAVRCAR